MIGLLQSGTGIGRGMCLPILSKGLLDACDAARGREAGVRAERWAIVLKATSVATPFVEKPVGGRLPRADELRRAPAARPAIERRSWIERRDGWPALLEISGANTTRAEDGGAVATTGTGALNELAGVLTGLGSDPLEDAGCLPAWRALPARPLDADPPVDTLPDESPPGEEGSPCERVPCEERCA
jgi:hypothetical protein